MISESNVLDPKGPAEIVESADRRTFLGRMSIVWLAVLAGAIPFLEGCAITLADVLKEIGNVLTFIAPLVAGILPIVEIADPALAPAVSAANAIFQAGVAAVNGFLQQWSNASAAAQPGIMNQLEAAAQTLQSQLSNLLAAAHVNDPTTNGEVTAIVSVAVQEVGALLTFIGQLKATGGTTASLSKVKVSVRYSGSLDPVGDARSKMVKHLRKSIGNAPIDAVRKQLSDKLDSLRIERNHAGNDKVLGIPAL
jgi:hypothetical protein